MHQANHCIELVDELGDIVAQNPYCTSNYVALFINCWNNTSVGRLNNFGYRNMWSSWIHCNMSPTMVAKECK